MAKDLLGNDLTASETAILAAYRELEALLDHELAPAIEANVKDAVAALWQALNDLALTDDRPDI